MALPSFELTGGAREGARPELLLAAPKDRLPTRVKLGAKLRQRKAGVPRLADFLSIDEVRPRLKESVDWTLNATQSLARVFLNDRYGDCVIAGKAHSLGVWTGEDARKEVMPTDDEVLQEYHTICGRGDNGCVISEVLDVGASRGWRFAGGAHKIDAYCEVDNRNNDLTKAALALFGPLTIGFDLPGAWLNSKRWDVTNSRIVGGHDVSVVGYTPDHLLIASWGRLYEMTWAAWNDRRYISECYCLLSPDWYGSDESAPSGLDLAGLKAAFAEVKGGKVPPEPTPPPPPGPPPPPPPGPPPHPPGLIHLGGEISEAGDDGTQQITLEGGLDFRAAVAQLTAAGPDFLRILVLTLKLYSDWKAQMPPEQLVADLYEIAAALGVDLYSGMPRGG